SGTSIPLRGGGVHPIAYGEAAAVLSVHKMALLRLIRRGVLPARQLAPGTPWVIQRADLDAQSVRSAVTTPRARPETVNADQRSLDLSTT
ncbi:MAG TPA: helix-turn-helix domain-containing protein, partial [Steroidobacteraceae bacterium]|nr:helix-turn-helix domain-containing protein [Steroidobacteraceae bacterium]